VTTVIFRLGKFWRVVGDLKESRIDINIGYNLTMSVRTYGDKPVSFQVDDTGEFYCIGSEVS